MIFWKMLQSLPQTPNNNYLEPTLIYSQELLNSWDGNDNKNYIETYFLIRIGSRNTICWATICLNSSHHLYNYIVAQSIAYSWKHFTILEQIDWIHHYYLFVIWITIISQNQLNSGLDVLNESIVRQMVILFKMPN